MDRDSTGDIFLVSDREVNSAFMCTCRFLPFVVNGLDKDQGQKTTSSKTICSQDASFQEFCEDPENRHFIIRGRRKELRDVQKSQDRTSASRFRDAVLAAESEAQTNMAPFIKHKVLRHIICSFTNGAEGNFDALASNPRVLNMLNQAKKVRSEFHSVLSTSLTSAFSDFGRWKTKRRRSGKLNLRINAGLENHCRSKWCT
mmetsp:Transcript_9804/g.39720  ORF Transcript_9804/g.39720 Transcript_9804/m.39720 type:complete len:201 (-) Transcript_9804:11-613(-)